MQLNNNYQAPSFGMAFRVKSANGVKAYINGVPEKIEEIYKFARESSIADKKHMRAMEKSLREHGIEFDSIDLSRYVPSVIIDEDGKLIARAHSWSEGYIPTSLEDLSLLKTDYQEARNEFRFDLRSMLDNRAKIQKAEKIATAAENIANKFKLDIEV